LPGDTYSFSLHGHSIIASLALRNIDRIDIDGGTIVAAYLTKRITKPWRVLLINVPHTAIGSRMAAGDHLPPLGLLAVGGPLLDDGHHVRLLDAELEPMSVKTVVAQALEFAPDAILFGHSGSSTAHPTIVSWSQQLRDVLPRAWIIYGGVFPTYYWREVLKGAPQIDVIVRGEGEETTRQLLVALSKGLPIFGIGGIAYRQRNVPVATEPALTIDNLDAYRVGWELIDFSRYSYYGGRRAAVVQFSRGCPHVCNFCGQRGFWTRWRHRDPHRMATEIAWLYRVHGVEVINFADEFPNAAPEVWRVFLEALIAENLPLTLIGSTRSDSIVRDAAWLHLYKRAGFERFLLGMENPNDETLALIRKGSTLSQDREAVRLLREHGILSLATWVFGFEEERDSDLWRGLWQLLRHDPDQVQLIYVTPHRWTPYYRLAAQRRVIQSDRRLWDYKHQVLATRHIAPWRLFLWVKAIEAIMQLRPRALWRVLTLKDRKLRHGARWYYRVGRVVWPYELWQFLFRERRLKNGPTLEVFWGAPQDAEEYALQPMRRYTRKRNTAEQNLNALKPDDQTDRWRIYGLQGGVKTRWKKASSS